MRTRCRYCNERGCVRRTAADVAVTVDDGAGTAWLPTRRHETLVSRDIDMRHRKTARKAALTALSAVQLHRTRTIHVAENALETSSDRRHRAADAAPLVVSFRPLIACRKSLLPSSLIDARTQAPTLAAGMRASLAEGHLAVRLGERVCPDALHEGI